MRFAITLHDIFTEESIGTILLKSSTDFETITDAWDKYQETHNSNTETEPNIYDFVLQGNWEYCEVLDLQFYQP